MEIDKQYYQETEQKTRFLITKVLLFVLISYHDDMIASEIPKSGAMTSLTHFIEMRSFFYLGLRTHFRCLLFVYLNILGVCE